MQIDWLTVAAQILNFLILVWLLRRFLYQPVVHAMDQRERRIAARIHDAEQREQTAAETTLAYERRLEALEQEREAFKEQARVAAESERQALLEAARSEVADRRSHWQHQVAEERQHFLNSLKYQAAESIQHIARRALADLADAELEEQIIRSFIHHLGALDTGSRQAIAATAGPVRVTTSFELHASVRGRLTRAVHEYIREGLEVDYSESPDLLCGIELTASGRRLSWTLADYLEALEQRMQERLETIRGSGG